MGKFDDLYRETISQMLGGEEFVSPYRFAKSGQDFVEQSLEGNPRRFIDRSDPNYQESIFAEPSKLPSIDTGGVAGVFAGASAKKAGLRMLDVAERALAAGKPPEEVKSVTGWFKGMEGKSKFEIDDSKMRLGSRFEGVKELKDAIRRPGGEYLGDVIRHEELFKNYPELYDVRVNTFYREPGGSNAVFDGKTISIAHDMTPEASKDTLMHEIQHWIQRKEGFARGGNTEMFEKSVREELPGVHEELIKDRMERKYSSLAGEIEARDAASRRTWDEEMRREVFPELRKDSIIKFGE